MPCLSSACHSPSAVPVTVRVSSRVLVFLAAAFLAGAFLGFSSTGAAEQEASGAGALRGSREGQGFGSVGVGGRRFYCQSVYSHRCGDLLLNIARRERAGAEGY